MLFYGCRYAKGDMLYADELEAFQASGITELQMAFSREPGQPRMFVQQVIERERDQVWDLIEAGAVIYVCGNANTMAPGVRAALMDIYRAKTNGSDSSAEEWLQGLRDADRYLEDIWGEMASAL
jgi:cytochrome P450/NADPH-cytochrome P450 reductase